MNPLEIAICAAKTQPQLNWDEGEKKIIVPFSPDMIGAPKKAKIKSVTDIGDGWPALKGKYLVGYPIKSDKLDIGLYTGLSKNNYWLFKATCAGIELIATATGASNYMSAFSPFVADYFRWKEIAKGVDPECPNGLNLGEDYEKHPECLTACYAWRDCWIRHHVAKLACGKKLSLDG